MTTTTMLRPREVTMQAAAPLAELPPSFLDDLELELARRERDGRMATSSGAPRYPVLEVVRSREHVRIHAEVPGLTWRDLRLALRRDELILEGERRPHAGVDEDTARDVVRREGAYGRFCRCLPLEVEVVPSEMRVRLRDGILLLEVPVAAESTIS